MRKLLVMGIGGVTMANYWLNLFTWTTWQEFHEAGGKVSGFREKRWATVQKMKPSDLLLCYMTGLSRFFAILEVTGKPYKDKDPIWSEATFPARVPVRVILELPPEHAVPVKDLSAHLSYFQDMTAPYSWTGHFRGSPTKENPADAEVIIAALEAAKLDPVYRDYPKQKLKRRVPPVYETDEGTVTIPDDADEIPAPDTGEAEEAAITHEEIQWRLLYLGSQLGLDVWVARNDRGRSFQGQAFTDIPRLRKSLPLQFDAATNRTIELIDVLWLQGNAIVAAFEIEHTTAVYSGLLRMADLITMQPNLNIPLYVVAPDERWAKVSEEVNRPTFTTLLNPPLKEICQFIPYSMLLRRMEQAKDFLHRLRPDFLEDISEPLEAGS
jgi:predicted RNA-binding protein